jgi:hypothetical protein
VRGCKVVLERIHSNAIRDNSYSVSTFSVKDDRLATENEVVAFGTESDGDTLAKEDESEDVAILCTGRQNGTKTDGAIMPRTFSRQSKKNLSGSLPYEIAEPRKGIQWNTSGGVDARRGIIWVWSDLVRPRDKPATYQLPEHIDDDCQHRNVDEQEQNCAGVEGGDLGLGFSEIA